MLDSERTIAAVPVTIAARPDRHPVVASPAMTDTTDTALSTTTIALANGTQIPTVGLGVWQVANDEECVNAVRWALELGYRHIDTAQAYGNEKAVGQGIRDSGVPREDVYITTKFYPAKQDPAAELEGSLRRLGVEYVDLYIVHWPQGGATWAWKGMETAATRGHARAIGVSNFDTEQLDEVTGIAEIQPTVNQIQLSPFEYRRGLVEDGLEKSIISEAYSPLGTGRHLGDARLAAVAERCDRTPAQVLIRWAIQKGFVVLPKSTHRDRIEENGRVFDFTLTDTDIAELDALDETGGTTTAREEQWWK
jgi:diketogulonate reductase-like aldo/keto reductase